MGWRKWFCWNFPIINLHLGSSACASVAPRKPPFIPRDNGVPIKPSASEQIASHTQHIPFPQSRASPRNTAVGQDAGGVSV